MGGDGSGDKTALLAGLNGGMIPVLNTHQGPVVYWPYPSPPVSPSNSFYAAQAQAAAAAALAAQQSMAAGPAIVLMRGLPFNASTTDILAFFQGYPDVRFFPRRPSVIAA